MGKLKRIRNLFLIFAKDENDVLGKDGTIPWYSPQDFAWFRRQTNHSRVIMGRKTWESLPNAFKPLPGRRNYVITRNSSYEAIGAVVASSLLEAINHALHENPHNAMFVLGGKYLLEEASYLASEAWISHIGVKTVVDKSCVMAPALCKYNTEQIDQVFAGNEQHPSVAVEFISFI